MTVRGQRAPDNEQGEHPYVVTRAWLSMTSGRMETKQIVYAADLETAKTAAGVYARRGPFDSRPTVRRARTEDMTLTAPTMTPAELAAKVAAHIRAHPEQHDQSVWLSDDEVTLGDVEKCGTTACVAGWAVLLHDGRARERNLSDRAAELLGLPEETPLFAGSQPRPVVLLMLDRMAAGRNPKDLTDAELRGADLRDAELRGANLTNAELGGANLTDADLRGADLRGADLRDAKLAGADLTDADLTDAELRGANLTNAELRGANLTNADLTNADLTGAVGLP